MELYLVILTIFLAQVYSYESFIYRVKEKTHIKCGSNSFFMSNETSLFSRCNMKNSCSIKSTREIFYVCVKHEYKKSDCIPLTNRTFLNVTGCYVGNSSEKIKPFLPKHPNQYYHFLVLYMSLWKRQDGQDKSFHSAITYGTLEGDIDVITDRNSWFLLKVSNKSEENFGEFLAESSLISTQTTTEAMYTFPMITTLKEEGQPISEGKTSPSTTVAPNEKKIPAHKVFIILGVVVVVLLTIFVLAAYAFYRKKSQNESTNDINEIPLGENERIENILAEDAVTSQEFNDHLDIMMDNELYQATTSVDRSQQKAQNKEYADASGAVYAEVNKIKEINNDHPMNPGDSSHVDVNGDIYTLVDKEQAKYENPVSLKKR